ncbi:MAG: hypothetical protein ABSE89_06835 [Sedimentisphaerales bacterium]
MQAFFAAKNELLKDEETNIRVICGFNHVDCKTIDITSFVTAAV